MTLVKYRNPWVSVNSLQDEINRLFKNSGLLSEGDSSKVDTSQWIPSVDLKEEKDRFIILADVPGVDPKEIEVSMEDGLLTIKGERYSEVNETEEGYVRIERSSGAFYRRFSLPDNADADNIKAKGKHGVLEIVIPKLQKTKPKTITVEH